MGIKVRKNNQWVTVATASLGTGTTKVAQLWDQKTAGTDGGTFTSGDWRDRTLNTENDPQSFVTLESGNVSFSLLSGTYRIAWSAPAYNVDMHKTQLVYSTNSDFSAPVTTIQGSSGFDSSNLDPNSQTRSFGDTQLTITEKTYFKIQHRCTVTQNTYGFGGATGLAAEIYTQVTIEDLNTAAGAGGGGGGGVTDGDKGDITVTNSGATWTIDNDVIEEKHINAGGTAANNKILQYDSTHATNWSWTDPGATVTTSDSPPASPSDGDLWWNSATGILNVYYADTNSSQWVNATGRAGGGSTSGITKIATIKDQRARTTTVWPPADTAENGGDAAVGPNIRKFNTIHDAHDIGITLHNTGTIGNGFATVIKVPAGTYRIRWSAPAWDVGLNNTVFQYSTSDSVNVDGRLNSSVTSVQGSSEFAATDATAGGTYVDMSQTNSVGVIASVTFTQDTYFQLSHWCYQAQDTFGLGSANYSSNAGDSVFAQVEIEDLSTAIKEPTGTDIPVGGIIMYHGTETELNALTNWKLCNGLNGTPNLADKFVICGNNWETHSGTDKWVTRVETGSAPGTETGGSKNAVLPAHSHTDPTYNGLGGSFEAPRQSGGVDYGQGAQTLKTAIDASGATTTGDDATQTGTNANLPPYFALAYIMRIT